MYLFHTYLTSSENGHAKRRKTGEARPNEPESEQEEHSLSLSQHSSPSQSDQEQNGAHKLSASPNTSISALQPFTRLNANGTLRAPGPGGANGTLRAPGPGGVSSRPLKTDQFLRTIAPHRQEVQFLSSDHKPQPRPPGPPLVCHSITSLSQQGNVQWYHSCFLTATVMFAQSCRLAQRFMGRLTEHSTQGTS